MINYFKSFRDYIPTWIICMFMFFGIFGWTFVVGLILLIIQCLQRRKIRKSENINNIESYIREIERLRTLLQEKEIQHNNIRNEWEMKIIPAKEIEINSLKNQILVLNDMIRKQNEECADVKKIPNGEKFVLCAGKYKGGVDLPLGIYDINIISGSGAVETNKPENLYFRMTDKEADRKKYSWTECYKNIEISDKTILKISENAKIEFSISQKYDFSQEMEEVKKDYETERRVYEGELATIKSEISILNNDLIKMYYNFSDYDKITSQECKNQLVLLKQKEQDMRENGEDVIIQNRYGRTKKTEERIARQMLRTFNAECDNIMLNISLKNIDRARSQIQKSFETINKLYAVDSAALQKKLLEVKLEQITLMYTYELKYQQERDIQRAIKEQMMEEAKAQKEIEEQRKRIEKDLQQHVGEINRLMKYLQKTQIEVEKQLYLDKIKELEDKVKLLEVDKETVRAREENAKAGFVYIISNIGSFGEGIYKIGMTRRLEPMDRIHELSSASVPFEFDVHAMIFSSDAPELENMLHKHFSENAVNKVNPRKEFYNVDIDEIERVVKDNYNDTVQFTKIPIAREYRQSLNMLEKAL